MTIFNRVKSFFVLDAPISIVTTLPGLWESMLERFDVMKELKLEELIAPLCQVRDHMEGTKMKIEFEDWGFRVQLLGDKSLSFELTPFPDHIRCPSDQNDHAVEQAVRRWLIKASALITSRTPGQ